ncbi:MAG: MBL fold metallo-hydrolase [Polyangiaceae bacterium]
MLVREKSGQHVLAKTGIWRVLRAQAARSASASSKKSTCSLAEVGVAPNDIDVVVLSHLHFDHAGGRSRRTAPAAVLARLSARELVVSTRLRRAMHPHFRDRASFIPELQPLIEGHGPPR